MLLKIFLLGVPFWICDILFAIFIREKKKLWRLIVIMMIAAFYLAGTGIFLKFYFNKNEYFIIMGAIVFIGYILGQVFIFFPRWEVKKNNHKKA